LCLAISLIINSRNPNSENTTNNPQNERAKEYLPRPTSPKYFAIKTIRTNDNSLLISCPAIMTNVFFDKVLSGVEALSFPMIYSFTGYSIFFKVF